LEALLNNGASPNSHNQYGNTLLHLAAMYGHNQSVELLLDKGAKISTDLLHLPPLLLIFLALVVLLILLFSFSLL